MADEKDPNEPNAHGTAGTQPNRVAFWKQELERADEREKHFRRQARQTIDRYDQEVEDAEWGDLHRKALGTQFNILWANTETLRPALYSGVPRPIVRRRWRDRSPDQELEQRSVDSGQAAKAMERCLSFSLDQYDFDEMASDCITDHLLPGRMVARVNYREAIEVEEFDVEVESDETGTRYLREGRAIQAPDRIEGGKGFIDRVALQQVWCNHIPWSSFRHSKAKKWRKVWWVAFEDWLNIDEVTDQFGAKMAQKVDYKHEKIPVAGEKEDAGGIDQNQGNVEPRMVARFWSIWNKRKRTVHIICDGLDDEFVTELDDPLRLKGFFPCPAPVLSVLRTDSLVPIPEFVMYQDQAAELDEITGRLSHLVRAIKATGAYDAMLGDEVQNIFSQDDLKLVPIQNYAGYADKGGMKSIDWLPIEQYSKAANQLVGQRGQIIQTIYEITGISDLLRGSTDPRETASAQNLKAQFGSRRLTRRQKRVERFFRDLQRLKAEVIAENFSQEQIELMTNMRLSEGAMALLRSDAVRDFLIDVETTDTAAPDEAQDKRDVTELFGAMSQLLAASQSMPPQIGGALVLYGIRHFRAGRDIEDLIIDFQEQSANQPPPENPEVIREKGVIAQKQKEQELKEQVAAREQKRLDAVAQRTQEREDQVAARKIQREDEKVKAELEIARGESNAKMDLSRQEKKQQLDFFETRELVSTAQKIDSSKEEKAQPAATGGDSKPVVVVEQKPNEIDTLTAEIIKSGGQDAALGALVAEQKKENEQREELIEIAKGMLEVRKEERTLQ